MSRLRADSTLLVDSIQVQGCASPDGPFDFNRNLARRRMLSMRDYMTSTYGIPADKIKLNSSYIAWEEFRHLVAQSPLANRDEILTVASQGCDDDARQVKRRLNTLKRINNGETWKYLSLNTFPAIRSAAMLYITLRPTAVTPAAMTQPVTAADSIHRVFISSAADTMTSAPEPYRTISQEAMPCSGWYLSTNAVEWAMFIANIKGEYDFGCRWSGALSLHYSAMNYFSSDCKFRLFLVRPEVRYWTRDSHRGLFIDGHLQMCSYNFALPAWKYRIQDTRGKHPALGGGIGVGYRLPLGKSRRWALECQIDAGVYHLKYDRFENRRNGQRVDTKSRTWAGIDNFALSIVYNFNISRQ